MKRQILGLSAAVLLGLTAAPSASFASTPMVSLQYESPSNRDLSAHERDLFGLAMHLAVENPDDFSHPLVTDEGISLRAVGPGPEGLLA